LDLGVCLRLYQQSIYSDKIFLSFLAFKNKRLDLKSLQDSILDIANILIIKYPVRRRSDAWENGCQKSH